MADKVSHRMSPFGAEVYALGLSLVQDQRDATREHAERMKSRYPESHVHECAANCGNAFFCRQGLDQCAMSPNWQCPRCEDEARDLYLESGR